MKTSITLFLILSSFSVFSALPTDPKASPEAVKLYQNLLKLQKKGVMFGHQDDLAYGEG